MLVEIPDQMYNDLVSLAYEMTTQDPRCTKMPHIFQIRDWKKVYDKELNGDTIVLINRDYDIEIETLQDLINYLDDYQIKYDADELKNMWSDNNPNFIYDIEEWLLDNNTAGENLELHSYSMEPVYSNSFLTAKAAQEHLTKNYYHYHEKADVYLNHAWRNPEAELVSTFLCGLIAKKLHT